jgi:hypothetical protein
VILGFAEGDDASQQRFDARVQEIVEGIRTDSLDGETLENYHTLLELAQSIGSR